jgi:lipoate-protein ligase B
MSRQCVVIDVGIIGYRAAWDKQKEAVRSSDRSEHDLLYLVEHPPVITIGRSGDLSNILVTDERLRAEGIEVIEIDRGGDVTYHGPGQLVAYPILNLNMHRPDIGWYLRALEEVILGTLLDLNINGRRIQGYTGVWVGDSKVAAIGVGVRRWVTFHGLALNISRDLDRFALITPCGIQDRSVTSIEAVLGRSVSRDEVLDPFLRRFGEVFSLDLVGLDDTPSTK